MGQTEEEDPSRGDESPNSSLETEGSIKRRPVSRTLSEKTREFEEISLESPDCGQGADIPENNNTIKMTELSKSGREMAAASDVTDSKDSKDTKPGDSEHTPKSISFHELFRFATRRDLVLVAVGALASVAGGCSMPVMIILFGQLADAFVSEALQGDLRTALNISFMTSKLRLAFGITLFKLVYDTIWVGGGCFGCLGWVGLCNYCITTKTLKISLHLSH